MLKSHLNLLEPRPSDRLRIGDRLVDLPLREIAPVDGGAEAVRVTLKSIGVLLVLVAHAGKVVSREALLEWVWPDTLPTDDVLTQAIAQLRKALGDDRERPRYIDTVAKQGYRLIAPVEWLIDADAAGAAKPAGAQDPSGGAPAAATTEAEATHSPEPRAANAPPPAGPRPRAPRTRAVSALAAVAAVASLATALWIGRERAPPPAPSPPAATAAGATGAATRKPIVAAMPAYQLITSKPQGEYRPSLSPDGALLVYVEEGERSATSSLWVQTSAPVPPQRLTEPVNGQWDMMPAWSPDGRQIAFIRENALRCAVMLIPAAGGSAREVGECLGGGNHRLGWYPDGKTLIGARMPSNYTSLSNPRAIEKALYRMSLEHGRWERIAYARSPSDEDMTPAVSPDGRWIAFQRNLSLGDLWRIPAGGGAPERLTALRGNFYGIAWTPDSRGLVFGRYVNGRVLLSTLDIASGRVHDYHDSGRHSLLHPSIAGTAGALAFEVETARVSMRVVDVPGEDAPAHANGGSGADSGPDAKKSPIARSAVAFETTGSNLMPSIAPDGRQLMFSSDRSADMRLWWADQTRPETLRYVEGFVPVARYPPVWNADSTRALAIGEGAQGMGAYEIDPQRGRAVKLPLPDADPVHIAYHPDPNRALVVADRGEGRLGVTLYDRGARPWRRLAEMDDVAIAMVDAANARIVLSRMSNAELWQTDLALRHARRVDRTALQRRNRTLTASPDGVWVMDSGPGCEWRWRLVARVGEARPREYCLGSTDWGLSGVSYHAGQRRMYLSMLDEIGSDIALLPLSALKRPSP